MQRRYYVVIMSVMAAIMLYASPQYAVGDDDADSGHDPEWSTEGVIELGWKVVHGDAVQIPVLEQWEIGFSPNGCGNGCVCMPALYPDGRKPATRTTDGKTEIFVLELRRNLSGDFPTIVHYARLIPLRESGDDATDRGR